MENTLYTKGYTSVDEAKAALLGLGIPQSMLSSNSVTPLFFGDNPNLSLVYTREGQVYFTQPAQDSVTKRLNEPEVKVRRSLEDLCRGTSGVLDDIVASGVKFVSAFTADGTSIDIVDSYGKTQYSISYSETTDKTARKPLAENIPSRITQIADAVEKLLGATKDSYSEKLNPIFDASGSN